MMAAEGQTRPVCSHGPRALDPVGVCQRCRDEAGPKPVCKVEGCGEAPYLGARGTKVGLCFEHFAEAKEREDDLRSARYDGTLARDNAIANAYEAIDARGGA